MIWVIIITTIVNWLIVAIIYFRSRLLRSETEVRDLRKENTKMDEWIRGREKSDQEESVRQSYNRGLYDGRQTDTLYRQMLKRYQAGEHISIIMNGASDTEGRHCNRRG